MLKILSLGAGVQSSTLFLMSCLGELPKLDHAIFADTGWEPREVYTHLEWLKEMGQEHGIPVSVVKAGNLRSDAITAHVRGHKVDGVRWASMPMFVENNETGGVGKIKRQCTDEYKIEPIERFIKRDILGLKPYARLPLVPLVEHWRGISTDEASRIKPSRNTWSFAAFPLCGWPKDYPILPMNRRDCQIWFAERFTGRELPRSACLGCPFHSNAEWRRLMAVPEYRVDIVEFDRAIRNSGGKRGKVYLHRSLIPIEDIDFRNAEDKGQLNMFENECSGHCGV